MSFALPFSFFLFSLEYSLIAPIDPAPMLHLALAVTIGSFGAGFEMWLGEAVAVATSYQ
jgi:hypothetical protein